MPAPARLWIPALTTLLILGCRSAPLATPDVRDLASPPFRSDFEAVLSPDGTTFALTSIQEDNFDIYVMRTDGSDMKRLTSHPERDAHPSWSPDGSRLAFVSNRTGDFELYVMNLDGTDLNA